MIVGNNILIEVIKIKIMMFVIERLNELEEKLEGMEAIIEAWINVDEKLVNFEKILLEMQTLMGKYAVGNLCLSIN